MLSRTTARLASILGLALGAWSCQLLAAAPPQAIVKNLLTEAVTEYPGHELNMITVTYPPGGSSQPHQHDAYILVYVLDGAVEMQVRGQPLRTVRAGETFVEHPEDVHEVSRNASADKPATFLVVALKETARPLTRPAASPYHDGRSRLTSDISGGTGRYPRRGCRDRCSARRPLEG